MAACFGAPAARRSRHIRLPSRSWSRSAELRSGTFSSGQLGWSRADTATETNVLAKLKSRLRSWFKRNRVVPEGYLSVDVGKEKTRYIIPIAYLRNQTLQALLDESVAEFGHRYLGVLQLACEEDELVEVLEEIRCCHVHRGASSRGREASPEYLLQKAKST